MDSAASHKVRVAALQFGGTEDVTADWQSCLALLDAAAGFAPALIVLPAFSLPHTTDQTSVEIEGPLVQALAAKAAEHHCFIAFNVVLRDANSQTSYASLLCDPQGEVAALANGELSANEPRAAGPVVATSAGRVGMLMDRNEAQLEAARVLALSGAQVLAVSLSKTVGGEMSTQLQTSARENSVFIIAASPIAPPPERPAPLAQSSQPRPEPWAITGATCIIAPDGKPLAHAPREGQALLIVDLELIAARCE